MSDIVNDYTLLGQRYGRHLRIVLQDAAPVNWNPTYAGQHWSKRVEHADRVRIEVMAALHELAIWPEPFTGPVHIIVAAYKSGRKMDADNVGAKWYVDALKMNGLIADDNPDCVWAVTTISRVDRDNPRIEIDVMEVA